MMIEDAMMKVDSLDASTFFKAFTAGGHEVIRQREAIDRINVFPVADGDTGTNLALTLRYIIENSRVQPTIGRTIASMADAALRGARGNSGIIFAEFVGGLAGALSDVGMLTVERFIPAADHAVQRACAALSSPVEGTILTVLREWAATLRKYAHLRDFLQLFTHANREAERSLERTPEQLHVLREANVVDAGAKGCVLFLNGMLRYLSDPGVSSSRESGPSALSARERDEFGEFAAASHAGEGVYPRYRYCTEAFLRELREPLETIRGSLTPFGDSLILAGSPERARVHLHTDDPAGVFAQLATAALIDEQKVDDMTLEYEVVHHRKYPIALVTDSACDLPAEVFEHYQIHVVPLTIIANGSRFLDGVTVTSETVYRSLEKTTPYPSTSQPAPAAFRLLYSFLSSHYESIVAVHVSGGLSGTFETSRREAERSDLASVSVVDSRTLSAAQALIVLRAAKAIAEGRSHEEVVRLVEESRENAKIFVSVATLKYMVRGGRVKPLAGFLAGLLNLKPIVSLDAEGKSVLYGKAFSRKANMRKIVNMVKAEFAKGGISEWAVVHAANGKGAAELAERVREVVGCEPLFIKEITPIIGLNAGPGAVAVVTLRE